MQVFLVTGIYCTYRLVLRDPRKIDAARYNFTSVCMYVLSQLDSLPPEVWLGEYKGNKVAIKMLKDIKDAKATKQFLAEASVMT